MGRRHRLPSDRARSAPDVESAAREGCSRRPSFDLADTMVGLRRQRAARPTTRHCTALLDAAAAGLSLADQRGSLRVVAASAGGRGCSSCIQLQNDVGPCLDCHRSGRPVSAENLATADHRWPLSPPKPWRRFPVCPCAADAVTRAVRRTLDLFRVTAGPLDEADVRVGQALADVATIGILQERAVRRSEVLAEQMQTALNSRIVIEQAKGMLAEHATSSVQDAVAVLRSSARDTNQRRTDVALDLVTGRLPAGQVLDHRSRRR